MDTTENRKGKCLNVGICSKANSQEIQLITDPFAEFICLECGLQLELIQESTEKKPYKKVVIISSLIVLTLIIGWIIISLVYKNEEILTNQKEIQKVEQKTDTKNELIVDQPSKKQSDAVKQAATVEPTSKPDVDTETHKKTNATVKYDYGYYEGPTINDLPHGQGIMYFNERHIINPKDPLKRYAEAGDYVSGVFHNGYLVNGKLYGKDKQQKEAIIIGQ